MSFSEKLGRYLRHERFEILREISLSIVVAALISSSITFYYERRVDQRIATREFIFDFSRAFFDNPKYRDVSVALEEQYLYGKPFMRSTGQQFSDYEVDDFLTLLQDAWSFYLSGFVSKKMFEDQYMYYLCVVAQSNTIKEYRMRLEHEGFRNPYGFIDDISKAINLNGLNCRQL